MSTGPATDGGDGWIRDMLPTPAFVPAPLPANGALTDKVDPISE